MPNGKRKSNQWTNKGYAQSDMMTANKGSPFHVKQISGKPYVRAITLPDSVKVESLMITEFPHRNTLAYLFTADNRLAIVGRDYSVHKTTVEYNPYRQGLTIIGDMFYYRQLLSESRMPDTIKGVAITAENIQHHNFNMRLSPSDVNKTTPKLYMMLESMPKRVDLEEPTEAFRSTDNGLEFIDMETNTVN